MDNPLVNLPFELPFDRVEPVHVEPAIDTLLEQARAALEALAAQPAPGTYASTFGALEQATEPLELASTVVDHLESVATTDALRAAHDAVQPKLSAFWSEIAMHEGVYRALRAFAETDEAKALASSDPTRARFVRKTLERFRKNGAELDPADKKRLHGIEVALTVETTKFAQNVLDATNGFERVVTDGSRLTGLPESARAAARQRAKDRGVEGYRFTLQAPSLIPALTYLDDRALREELWRAHNSRATGGAQDNRARIVEILRLRRAKARLVGYRDFADLVTEERMAKSGAHAEAFVDGLREQTTEAFERERRELDAFVRETAGEAALPLAPWDVAYYAEKLRKARFDFDEEALRPYFSAPRVVQGFFDVVEALYGVRVRPHEAPVWNPDVRVYRLEDPDGALLAVFYVDLFPREDKRGGAWMTPMRSGVGAEPQLGSVCANITPAIGDAPALLTHREVETVFHELGHLMHHALSRVSVRSLAGTNVAWDFVELPSQIMENWCWEREALDRFARHHETDAPIPDALFDKLQRARTFRAATGQMRQLGFATLDLQLHRHYDPDRDGDVMAYARDILAAHAPAPLPDDYGMVAGFTHLFADPTAYAAGYYSYKWAEVLDADAFTRFQREGVVNAEVGAAFRDAILSRGDSDEPEALFEAFMGRAPSQDALLTRLGIRA
ncbi:MAG: M3 family metallopeptidase [Myxococcales bacterium]|nr:M3 family metallopeptidase [Myxococcales bacterium]